jgi:signal transduction histidine kinase
MRIILTILLCLSGILYTGAQNKMLKYSYRHFGTENGLTQNSVSDAVFDKNGYLWISVRTDNVFVYDGYSFTPCWFYENGKRFAFKSASLFCNIAGDILIAHENGIHVRKQKTGAFEQVSKTVISRENQEITFIGEGKQDEIYFYNRDGIYVLQKSAGGGYHTDTVITSGNATVYFERSVNGVAKKSFFWFSKLNERDFYLFDITQRKITKEILLPKNPGIIAVLAVDSSLYGLANNFALYKANTNGWQAIRGLNNLFQKNVQWQSFTFTNESTGEVFTGSNEYLYKFNRDFTSLPSEITNIAGKPVLSKGNVTKILQKDAAHLWLFTTAEGIYQLDIKPKKFEHFKVDEGSLNFVRSIYKDESNGYIFSGLFYGGLVIYDTVGKIIKSIPLPRMSKDDRGGFCVNAISKLANNMYMVWYNAGRAYLLNTADWTMKSIINSGHAWEENYKGVVTDYAGFLRMGENKFASGYKNRIYFFDASPQKIQMQDSITCSLLRPEAFYYAAPWFYYGGIGSFYRYHTVTKRNDSIPLPFTTKVKWISRDKYNRLWVSTESGIAIVENDKPDSYQVVKTLTTDDGLPNHYIYVTEPDNKGKMWCSSNKGIFSIDINNYSVTSYSTVDGLQSEEFNTGAFSRDNSGGMFFGGVNGINFFHPASMEQTSTDDKVRIDYIGSAGTILYQYPDKLFPETIQLSYKSPSLQLHFSALNYNTTGFNQYEYKLQAFDSNWVDNGSNNELQLVLTPGKYEIQIRLKDNPASAGKLSISVAPPFYQTLWFLLLVFAALAAVMALIVNQYNKMRYRKRIAVLEMQQKVQQEKERIARDLHDNLGVQANAILHNSTLLNPEKEDYKNVVANLQETAKEMLLNLRETLWAMKTADVTATDIWLRIINFMQQMGRHYTSINFKVEGEVPKDFVISSNKALNMVLMVQESVNNAVKHAEATTITTSCASIDKEWVIAINDDGKGFDMNTAKEKIDSYGLQNMQERAQAGNFKYSIETVPGKGTKTIITVTG